MRLTFIIAFHGWKLPEGEELTTLLINNHPKEIQGYIAKQKEKYPNNDSEEAIMADFSPEAFIIHELGIDIHYLSKASFIGVTGRIEVDDTFFSMEELHSGIDKIDKSGCDKLQLVPFVAELGEPMTYIEVSSYTS